MTGAPDVVIVGSGPAGVSAAWPLVLAGLRVLMIDASRPQDNSSAPREAWKSRFGVDFRGLELDSAVSPKLATPQAHAARAGYEARLALETRNFLAVGSLGQGGLSKIWGALAEPYSADELTGFPFPARDLEASYSAVQRRIGAACPGGDAEAPTSRAAARLLARHRARPRATGLQLSPARNAVLFEAREDRLACNRCGECLYGCARGAIYDSALELPALRRFVNFTYAPDHFALGLAEERGRPSVEVESGGARSRIAARKILLAAGCISSTALALRRIGYTGRPVRLLSNPSAAAAFLSPGLIGAATRTEAFSLGQLFFRLEAPAARAAGVIYGAEALPADLFAARLPFSRPFALRLARALAPGLLVATCYAPGEFSRNELTVREDGEATRIAISGERTAEAETSLRHALAALRRALARCGALPVPGSTNFLPPGADIHYGGTLPMGGAGANRTTIFGELPDAANVHVVDGACLPDLPATHPTLTIMANADRIGREVARLFKTDEVGAGAETAERRSSAGG